MAIFRANEVHQMRDTELAEQLQKLQMELVQKYGKVGTGGSTENPGRIRELKRTIARIKTEMNQRARRAPEA
ncbi:MAG: 50S ribosomal protein L29 [Methanomicrobiales archaeon]|nr:50S ribosomal protein L29 [Methanomicrobiales archaeon]MDI6875949.1 50S ribosomal protein L29 [Methanomicrobiales archaeon]